MTWKKLSANTLEDLKYKPLESAQPLNDISQCISDVTESFIGFPEKDAVPSCSLYVCDVLDDINTTYSRLQVVVQEDKNIHSIRLTKKGDFTPDYADKDRVYYFEKNKPLGITRLNVDPDVRDDLSPFDYPALSEIDTKYFSYLALNNMQLFNNIQSCLKNLKNS